MKILIKNGRVIDPKSKFDKTADLLIEDDRVKRIADKIDDSADRTIDAKGCLVLPGLIDIHVHFREPGREDKETILGGSKVAAKSGYTSVCTMPNTEPVIDNQALVRFVKHEASKGPINVFPVAAISKGLKGEEISEMGELLEGGAVGFSDDGKPVMNSLLMRRALEYAKMFNTIVMVHEEDITLADSGIMNEGKESVTLGLKGITGAAEDVMVARDVILARLTDGRIHFQHISTKTSVDIIRAAKKEGLHVTCESAPHYFSLNDKAVREHLSMAKMNPPLRSEEDRLAVLEGLKDGTIDAIATDHAPHLIYEKRQELEYAPNGIVGLETALPLIITKLVKENGFSYADAFAKVTCNPASIVNIDRGELKEGAFADVVIVDPEKKVEVTEDFMLSACKNSPFIGMELTGSVEMTICNGRIVYEKTI